MLLVLVLLFCSFRFCFLFVIFVIFGDLTVEPQYREKEAEFVRYIGVVIIDRGSFSYILL